LGRLARIEARLSTGKDEPNASRGRPAAVLEGPEEAAFGRRLVLAGQGRFLRRVETRQVCRLNPQAVGLRRIDPFGGLELGQSLAHVGGDRRVLMDHRAIHPDREDRHPPDQDVADLAGVRPLGPERRASPLDLGDVSVRNDDPFAGQAVLEPVPPGSFLPLGGPRTGRGEGIGLVGPDPCFAGGHGRVLGTGAMSGWHVRPIYSGPRGRSYHSFSRDRANSPEK